MTITFELDAADNLAFQYYHFETDERLRKIRKRQRFLIPAVCTVVAAALLLAWFGSPVVVLCAASLLLFSLIWVGTYPRRVRKETMKRAAAVIDDPANASHFLGSREMSFAKSGIEARTPESDEKVSWNAVRKIGETPAYYFIFISTQAAFIVPKKKLSGDIAGELQGIIKQFSPAKPVFFADERKSKRKKLGR